MSQVSTDHGNVFATSIPGLADKLKALILQVYQPHQPFLTLTQICDQFQMPAEIVTRVLTVMLRENFLYAKTTGITETFVAPTLFEFKKKSVGILVEEPVEQSVWTIYHLIIAAIKLELQPYQIRVKTANFKSSLQEAHRQGEAFLQARVDGIIYHCVSSEYEYSENKEVIELFERQKVPVVLIDKYFLNEPENYSYVVSDNHAGGKCATEHLIKSGYRQIALVRDAFSSSATLREEGYRQALFEAGIRYDEALIKYFTEPQQLYTRLAELFEGAQQPQAIFAINDLIANEIYVYLAQRGLKIPQDVAVIGFDDMAHAGKLKPPLTTVRQNFSEMGRLTAQFLLQRLGKFTALPRKILPCELVIRESCGAARITQRRSSRPIKIGPVPPPTESATLADATSVKKSAAKIDTIGLMYRQFEDELYPDIYYSKIRKGIEDTAGKKHYQILSSIPFKTKNEEYQAIRELLRRNIDGLIFVATHDLLPPAQEELVFIFRRRIPFIILAHCESAIMPYVTVDDRFGGYLAMEHLIAARRQVIGALLANPGDLISDLRNRGFHDAMLQAHFDPQNLHIFRNLIKPGQTQFEAAYLWAKELDLAAHPLQGLICLNDMLARGAIKALLERGLVIPEQIAVIGYDDSGIDGRDQIPLTTVQVPCYEIGRLGMQLLAEQIENQTRPERVQLKPALVIRQSG